MAHISILNRGQDSEYGGEGDKMSQRELSVVFQREYRLNIPNIAGWGEQGHLGGDHWKGDGA